MQALEYLEIFSTHSQFFWKMWSVCFKPQFCLVIPYSASSNQVTQSISCLDIFLFNVSSSLGIFSVFQMITDKFCQVLIEITWDGIVPVFPYSFFTICCLVPTPRSCILGIHYGSAPLLIQISVRKRLFSVVLPYKLSSNSVTYKKHLYVHILWFAGALLFS